MRFLRTSLTILVAMLMVSASSCEKDKYPDLGDGLYAEFVTSKGTIVAKLTVEETPVTVANFVALAEGTHPMVEEKFKGKKFYNGLIFHRVMNDFMIQGGCPDGTGSGSPGYRFADEFSENLKHDKPGVLSMANPGPDSNGSQFFITEKPTPWLDGVHSVFGQVVLGMEVHDSISNVEVGAGNRPVEEVVLQEINIVRQGFDARKFDAVKTWETELPKLEERRKKYEEEKRQKEEEAQRIAKEKAAKAAAEVVVSLNDYKSKGTATTTGLIAYQIEKGDGLKPNQGDRVKVQYEGYFTDGRLFGSSSKELEQRFGIYNEQKENRGFYGELTMTVSPDANMIPGFKEGVSKMRIGDKYYFYLPSHLAYGERGSPPVIPPNTDIVYIIKMLSIAE